MSATAAKTASTVQVLSQRQPGRLYFLDNFRSFITQLVILFHVAVAYMSMVPWWWYVLDTRRHLFFDFFFVVLDVFIMPGMFLVAGYFAIQSLARKGREAFLCDKFKRVVIPFAAGVVFLAPAITYFCFLSRTREVARPAYFYFWRHIFFGEVRFRGMGVFNEAQYWFLGALALLYLILALAYSIHPKLGQVSDQPESPPAWFLAGFGLLMSAIFFGIHVFVKDYVFWMPVKYLLYIRPTRFFAEEVMCFFLGVHAYRKRWFTASGYSPRPGFWVSAASILGVAFVSYRILSVGKFRLLPVKAGYDVVHSFFCLSILLALIAVFRVKLSRTSRLLSKLAANSYSIYYVHMLIVIPMNLAVRPLPLPAALKFVMVAAVSIVLSFWASEYVLSRIPVFGGSTARAYRQLPTALAK